MTKTIIFIDDSQYMSKAEKILDQLMDGINLKATIIKVPQSTGKKYGKAETAQLLKWAEERVTTLNPRFIVTMGSNSYLAFFSATGLRKSRGRPVENRNRILLPTFHPNTTFHDPKNLELLQSDFQRLAECIEFGGIPEERSLNFKIVDTLVLVDAMIDDLKGCVAGDLETTRLYPFTTVLDQLVEKGEASIAQIKEHKAVHNGNQPRVVSCQFGTVDNQWVVPLETAGIWTRSEQEDIVERITDALEDCYLVGQNWKFDSLWMRVRFGVVWTAQFDTMLAHYILDENSRHGLKEVAQTVLGAPDWDVGGDVKTTWSLQNAKYAAHDVFYTRKLRYYLGKKLNQDEEVKQVFDKILMPCSALFTEIEYDGVYIDQSKFEAAEAFLYEEVAAAEKELDQWGHPEWAEIDPSTGKPTINWASSQQLSRLLFNDLEIPPLDKTDGGNYSVSESVLQRIEHEMIGALLRWRGAQKQLSSFIEGWKPYLDTKGFLHPSFKLHGTVTGRPSCEHPNLQQTPRDPRIRSLVSAPKEWELIEADLSQIELRIAAFLANETSLLEVFHNKGDAHWLTAIREIERGAGYKTEVIETAYRFNQTRVNYSDAIETLLNMGVDTASELMEMWKEIRKKAKAINFGFLFGMWWKKFRIYARDNYDVIVTDEQAQAARKAFFALYPKFPAWHDRQRRFARHNGFVRSLSGRKRRLPAALAQRDTAERREAERQAINSPVQGFAAELNLMAALQIRKEFSRKYVRLVGTVHDSCLMLVRKDWVERVYKRVLEIMSSPQLLTELDIQITVPLEAEAKIGPWSEGIRLEKWLKQQS